MEIIKLLFQHLNGWGLTVILLITGILEFSFGLYRNWKTNEKLVDISSILFGKLLMPVVVSWFALTILPTAIPQYRNVFSWVPFWWGVLLLAVSDDLTQYWYHRLHHEVPWLWKFHRTHHSAPYMGMAMAGRQNFIYTILFPQIYVTITLTYLGMGLPAGSRCLPRIMHIMRRMSATGWDIIMVTMAICFSCGMSFLERRK